MQANQQRPPSQADAIRDFAVDTAKDAAIDYAKDYAKDAAMEYITSAIKGGGAQKAAAAGTKVATTGTGAGVGIGTGLAAGAGIAAGSYGLYDTFDRYGQQKQDSGGMLKGTGQGAVSGAVLGASIGSIVPGIGTAIGAVVGGIAGGLAGGVAGMSGSGKDDAQIKRDSAKELLQQVGVLDQDFRLRGGSKDFNFGLDGGARLQNVGENIDGETDRGYYDVDFSNPLSDRTVALVNPLAQVLFGSQDKKVTTDMVGYFTNYAQEGAQNEGDVKKALVEVYGSMGIKTSDDALALVKQAQDSKRITAEQGAAASYAVGQLFGDPQVKESYGAKDTTSQSEFLGALFNTGQSRAEIEKKQDAQRRFNEAAAAVAGQPQGLNYTNLYENSLGLGAKPVAGNMEERVTKEWTPAMGIPDWMNEIMA